MGEYVLNSLVLSIPMGGVDVVLGVQWEIGLWGIAGKPGKIISSNVMKKLLKKEQRGVIAQLCSLEVPTSKSSISVDL